MKSALRIFNLIIMALAAVATVFLFSPPMMSFTSNIAISTETFAKFVPETIYTQDIDIVNMLGTDRISFGINFTLDAEDVKAVMNGDKDQIDSRLIYDPVADVATTLHEPIDLITEYSVKSVMNSTIKDQIKTHIQEGIENYENKSGSTVASTPEEIMDEVGMNDDYFKNFTIILYNALNVDGATVDTASNVLFAQIDEALAMAEDSGMVDSSNFGTETKTSVKNSLVDVLTQLKLVYDGDKIKKISEVAYIYMSTFMVDKLTGIYSEAELTQETGETNVQYADRLLTLYIVSVIPESFYTIVGYVTLALYIGLYVFTGLWVLLIVITLIKTFTKKPWTIFGPWFWIIGGIQLVLGIGLIILGKIVLPGIDLNNIPFVNISAEMPVKSIILSPRTYAVIPSLIYGACIIIAFIYGFFKRSYKKKLKSEKGPKPVKQG